MGKISNRLIKMYKAELSKTVVDLDAYRRGKAKAEENVLQINSVESLVEQHGDVSIAIYYHLQNLISVLAEDMLLLNPLKSFYRFFCKVEDLYQPSYPPMSPITNSYFNLWTMFDVALGDDKETVGSCLYDLAALLGFEGIQKIALQNLCRSRMGIYEVSERNGNIHSIKELLTDNQYELKILSGYKGQKNDLIFLRIVPPLLESSSYIAMTTPYQLEGYSLAEWIEYFARQNITKTSAGFEQALYEHFKYGNNQSYWSEFIFYSYLNYRPDVIYLTGIPDKEATQPHHRKFSEVDIYNKAFNKIIPRANEQSWR